MCLDELAELEQLLEGSQRATGILLVEESLSTDDVVAAMRAGVRYAAAWPLDEEALIAEMHAVETRMRASRAREGRVMTFLSSQGGSGTTFVATQIAHACAHRLGKKVLVIDADRQYADAQLFLSADMPTTTLVDLAAQVDRLDSALFDAGVQRLSSNLDVLPGAGDPIKAAQIQPHQLASIMQFACPRYDVVIVDAGHHIDATILMLLDYSAEIFTVMRQSVPDLYSVTRLTAILQELGYSTEKVQTIVNQFDSAAKVDLDVVRDTLRSKMVHTFPSGDKALRSTSDDGIPLLTAAPRCKLARAIDRFACQHLGAPKPENRRGWFSAFRGTPPHETGVYAHPVRYS
ncbi:hypothetical protein WJ69_34390 [Burkholderia ubonensis]|nr:hypothetical protein WJ69_34390 [Burkholderia ubonensis]